MKWSDIIRADIIMGATGPSAQIMSDQITSDKVVPKCPILYIPIKAGQVLGRKRLRLSYKSMLMGKKITGQLY